MQPKFLHAAFCLVLITLLQLSCKREYSKEGGSKINLPPVALAGADQSITLPTDSVLLNGTNSSDPDGQIMVWRWTKIAGPASFTFIHPDSSLTVVRPLSQGVYLFVLKVTDNQGAFALDTVKVTVNSVNQVNHPPIACAGADQSIILPIASVQLNGNCSSDPDNNMATFLWTKIAGPATFSLGNATSIQAQATNLMAGVYRFELRITDSGGLTDRDTMMVTVSNTAQSCTQCQIVFVSDRDGNDEIYICNADGTNTTRLTNNTYSDYEPMWSPDGSKIAFTSFSTGSPEIYVMNADGSNIVQKTFFAVPWNVENPTWSPDGTRIAFDISDSSYNLWVVNASSGAPSMLLDHYGEQAQPSWSPDGSKIIMTSDGLDAFYAPHDICSINADGSNFTRLTNYNFDQLEHGSPRWSPSGNKIAMIVASASSPSPVLQAGIMNPDGTGLTIISLPNVISGWSSLSWSADGTKLIYDSNSGLIRTISWVAVNGSGSGVIISNGHQADWKH
jgi:hypothetical protein